MGSQRPLHILVTGASGYIGDRFVEAALRSGARVTSLGRSPVQGTRHVPWSLGESPPEAAFAAGGGLPAVDAVVHLAHQWLDRDRSDVNADGTDRLLAAARHHAVSRFLFASSLSSRPDALNRYGRVKWAIEQTLHGPVELNVRIGLVYGGPERGVWGALCRLVRGWPLLPMIDPWRRVQPIHLDDLCQGLLELARLPDPSSSVYVLGDDEGVPFGRFLKLIAGEKLARRQLIVPLPSAMVLPLIGLVERLPLPIDRERVLGLAGARTAASNESLRALGLELRPLAAGLAGEMTDRRRRLLVEGRVLTTSLLGAASPAPMARLYARAVETAPDARPLALPALLRWCPPLVRAAEPVAGGVGADRARARLRLAALVVDASPQGAAMIYDYRGTARLAGVARLLAVGVAEALLLPLRLVVAWLVWR